MTLQEAIMDKERPLSVTPQEWMQYDEAREEEEKIVFDGEAEKIAASDNSTEIDSSVEIDSDEKLEIGIEQMILGCRISMRSIRELERIDVSPKERSYYDFVSDIVNNAIAPYLSDILSRRKKFYSE